MIINLNKYREHGYLKALGLIFIRMFLKQNQKIVSEKSVDSQLSFRNYPQLMNKDDGKSLCISCGLCEQYCPAKCIKIESSTKSEDLKSGPAPKSFKVALDQCTRCHLCKDICPTDAVQMQGNYQIDDFTTAKDLLNI